MSQDSRAGNVARRYRWIDDMREAPVPSGPMLAAFALFHFMNAEAVCWPGAKRLAAESGASERSIRRWLDWLDAQRMIERDERAGLTPIVRGRPRSEGWEIDALGGAGDSAPAVEGADIASGVVRTELPGGADRASDEPPRNPPENNLIHNRPRGAVADACRPFVPNKEYFANLTPDLDFERHYQRRAA